MKADTIHSDIFTPQSFEVPIVDSVKRQNTVACMNTNEYSDFLLVTVVKEFDMLSKDQYKIIIVHKDEIDAKVKLLSMHTYLECKPLEQPHCPANVYVTTLEQLLEVLDQKNVFFFSGQSMNVNLLVFTRCEEALALQCDLYKRIMKYYDKNSPDKMRIFAMTYRVMKEITSTSLLRETIKYLGETFYANIEVSKDMVVSDVYGISPDEIDCEYQEYYTDRTEGLEQEIKDIMMPTINFLKRVLDSDNNENNTLRTKALQIMNECLSILKNLGIWCASNVANILAKKALRDATTFKKNSLDSHYYYIVASCLARVYAISNNYFTKCVVSAEDFKKIISPKVLSLIEICKQYKPLDDFTIAPDKRFTGSDSSDESEENESSIYKLKKDIDPSGNRVDICGIVFVDRRHTALILSKLLEEYTNFDSDLFHVRSKHLFGGNNEPSFRKREETLKNFRQRQINLLFVIAGLNDKLDIPRCNVVIRFDPVGCARTQNSKYFTLLPRDCEHLKQNILEYKKIETLLKMLCMTYVHCSNKSDPEYEEPPLYNETMEECVTLNNSIALVNRYCVKLPNDSFTHLAAHLSYERLGNKVSATLVLPMNSQIKEPIKGNFCHLHLDARRSAALKACYLLYKCRELDSNLQPNGKDVIKYEDLDNEWYDFEQTGTTKPKTLAGTAKPGSSRHKCIYPKRVARSLRQNIGEVVFLYEIRMKLEVPATDAQNTRNRKIYPPEICNQSFGIISKIKIPKIPLFPIFIRSGEISVEICELSSAIEINENQRSLLFNFHRFIFHSVLKLEKSSMIFSPNMALTSYVIVPLKANDIEDSVIDWDFVHDIETCRLKTNEIKATKYTYLPYTKEGHYEFNEDQFEDAVVTPSYRNTDSPQYFYVAEIRDDLSPKSNFPTKDYNSIGANYRSFADYYISKYSTKIQDLNQPLIDVDHTNARLNLLTPRFLNQKGVNLASGDAVAKSERKIRRDDQKQLLVPELCRIHVMSGSLWRKAICIPAVLYRLNYLIVAEELRDVIARKAGVGCKTFPTPNFRFDPLKFTYPITSEEFNGTSSGDFTFSHAHDAHISTFIGPSSCHILQSLTMSCCNDFFNLERLETIGDSFLKYAITVHLYLSNKKVHEGRLSYMRSKHVSNYNLYSKGKDRRIGEYMVASKFEPGDNWLPPCYKILGSDTSADGYNIDDSFSEVNLEDAKKPMIIISTPQTEQCIPDKSIADCVEALIGCYLINGGDKAATRFMSWLLKMEILDSSTKYVNIIRIGETSLLKGEICGNLTQGFDTFESSIEYTFKNRMLLLQVFTHASYKYNKTTDCYQRLEFLGDAILDYMITRYVFEDKAKYSPGVLTDMRSALVNNNMFAALAVKWKLHKHIKSLSASQFKVIDLFITSKYSNPDLDMDNEITMDATSDEIEYPKALADLFEALAGAIYLDSNMNLDVVWKVYYRLMKSQLDAFSKKIPKSPVRELLEMEPETAKFEKPIRTEDGRFRVSVNVLGKDCYQGIGRNYKIAKSAAAKQALKCIKAGNLKAAALQINATIMQ